jgi:hypothetical protein
MTSELGMSLLAAEGGLLDAWQDRGPLVWAVAVALALAWLAMLGVLTALTDPRRVEAGPATLDVPGDERPAVVNLVTADWDLGREAVPATLVDLAARRYLAIDQFGGQTLLRVREHRAGDDDEPDLTRYEDMVLRHVRALAARTDDGVVPAAALTTGPQETARRWWKQFTAAVTADARARGLSRPRWTVRLKALMATAAVPVAVAVGLAMSTIPDDPHDDGDNPVGAAVWSGLATFVGLSTLAGSRSGERDTPDGRVAASRWLGVQAHLASNTLFTRQPPAAVAVWDHLLAHGTALGVAHGVVEALPLGAESEHEAWSSVGGRWRVVRVRYPRWRPPGYGLHPALVALAGLPQLALGGAMLAAPAKAGAPSPFAADGEAIAYATGLAVYVTVAGGLALRGAAMAWTGLADLVTGRTAVEGRVLRRRNASSDKRVVYYLAVDDGTTDRVRAWRFRRAVSPHPGDMVRARVTHRLQHVADLEPVRTTVDLRTGQGAGASGTVTVLTSSDGSDDTSSI